jgi:TfoX/Sxy family transcriptional regulator of competence genes
MASNGLAMGYDEKTAERVRRALSGRPGVVEKRMVGGRSFIVNGNMCCGVTSTGLMVRLGNEGAKRALTEPHVRPMEFGGRRLLGFVEVEPDGYRRDKALAKWVQRGLEFAASLRGKGSDDDAGS